MKITEKQLEAIINGHDSDLRNILFFNLDDETINEARIKIQNKSQQESFDVIIEFDENDIRKVNNIITSIPILDNDLRIFGRNIIWRDYLLAVIYKALWNHPEINKDNTKFTKEDVESYMHLINAEDFEEYKVLSSNISHHFHLSTLNSYIERQSKEVIFHFLNIDIVKDKCLQGYINAIISWRGSPTVRTYACESWFVTYYCTGNSLIERVHDYSEYSGIEKNKVLEIKRK